MTKKRKRTPAPPPFNRLDRSDLAWLALLGTVFAFLIVRNFVLGQTDFQEIDVGPLRLSPFGPLVALNMLFGYSLVKRWCERFELDWETLAGGLVWIVLLGLYISHWVSIAFYFPEDLTDPIALLDARTRLSSFGGMFGGGAVAILYLRRKGLPAWRYGDALAYGFIGGYIFGRMGCFAIHDHPGRPTDIFLAPTLNGVQRHDLGLYEVFLMSFLLLAVHWVARHGRPRDGAVIATAAFIYPPVRFFFDSLRVADVRYAGLTPGQWFCFPLLAVGIWWLFGTTRKE